jgi:two-component system, LytTR family, sensor histidine kinase AlgZ
MKTLLKTIWQVSKHTSTAYKITQGITGIILMFYMMSNTFMLDMTDVKGGTMVFAVRGIVESVIFILLTHFLLRTYLKLQVVNQGLSLKSTFTLSGILLLVSIISVILSFQVGNIPYFEHSQPEDFSFMVDGKEVFFTLDDPKIWAFVTINQLFFFGGWVLIYIVWHAIASKRELQKQMQEARIQQLTNQLSPHFLFNTLNSIRALIYEDKDKAADLVTQLSEIFRTHRQAHLQSSSTLEEEWLVAERYLTIEKARLEERLTLKCDIDEHLWQQKLPTLSLLTLIENAIKHGISPNPEKGYITITAKIVDSHRWRLEIHNSVCEKNAKDGTKTGLKNTKDRLELMFGSAVIFNASQNQNQYVINLELPYDKNPAG